MSAKFSRRTVLFSTAATLACLFALAATSALQGRDETTSNASKTNKLVLHEWGTFTNFSGANGAYLDYRPLTEDRLPGFVDNPWVAQGFGKRMLFARQRMETPVAYFYSDVPREVQVRVDFPAGMLTDWYPPAQDFAPRDMGAARRTLKNSFLDWGTVRILPPAQFEKLKVAGPNKTPIAASLPPVTPDDHYGYARETDAAVLETSDPMQPMYNHYEKFLFYRGIGNFDLPVKLAALGGDRFEVTNFGDAPLGAMFLVEIENGAARYSQHSGTLPHDANYLQLPQHTSSIDQLADDMVAALTATGLYEKEARAMVKTWRSSWFGERGTRLLYLVPRAWTDGVIPLTVTPPPDEVVRVLVGRMEVLTPEDGREILDSISEAGTCFTPDAEPLASQLAALCRFAEPALTSLLPQTDDFELRNKLEQLRRTVATR